MTKMTLHTTSGKMYMKEVIHRGIGLHKPNEGAICKVVISPSDALPDAEGIIGYPISAECEICLGTGIGRLSSIVDQCMESMRCGEKCKLVFDEELVKSPDGSKWKFDIHLIEFTRSKDVWEMTLEEKLARASMLKELGTKCFKAGRVDQAELFYLRGLKYAIATGQLKVNQPKLLLTLNVAACQLKHNRYRDVITHCTSALNMDSNSTKALFRRGQAYVGLQDFELAQADFEQCLQLEPTNKAVQNQLELLVTKRKKLDTHYAQAMSKMFGTSSASAQQH